MEKFKTLNNSPAKRYIRAISEGDFRVCTYLLFNLRDTYVHKVYARLVDYYFKAFEFHELKSFRQICRLLNVDLIVEQYIVKLYNNWKGGVYDESMENFCKDC